MKLETFYEKFDLFANAPDALVKMRELVLELAIQGGLVAHSLNEEAVPYEKGEDADPINVSEVPSNWRVVLLADAIKNRSGNSKLIKGKLHEEPGPGLFQGFSASGADVWCDDYEHEGNAIIISAVGARCGKAFKASGRWSAIANTNITRPESTLFDFDFAYLVLNNEHFWVRGGSAQPFVKFPPSLDRYFAVPPLAEQKRIVAKVNELMALCDRLEAQQQERETQHVVLEHASLARFAEAPTPDNLQFLFHDAYAILPANLRKSILALAVQGKLVPQDPNDEPAWTALARLEARGANVKTRRSVPAEVSRPDSLDVKNLPQSWVIESTARLLQLGAILDLKDGNHGANHPKVAEFTETGLPFITAAQVSDDGRIDYDGAYKVSGEALNRLRVGFAKPNDVIYTHKGSVGRVAICNRDCVLTPQTTYYRVNEEVLSSGFVRTYLLSPLFRDQVDLVKRQTTRDFVPINAQYQFFLRVPPLAEQRRIVAKVDELMTLVDALETQIVTARAAATNLLAAAVAELTRGSRHDLVDLSARTA